jgi:GNAT superfamily N-acetyltransferase
VTERKPAADADEARANFEAHPLTPDRWTDLETLFGKNGAYAGCWCMWWRLTGPEWQARKGEANKAALHEVVDSGEVPGIIGYVDGVPAGWCAIAPRDAHKRLREERVRIFKKVDDQPVWSVTCFYIARAYRRQGMMLQLLNAAVDYARSRGATIVEGFPLDTDARAMTSASAYTGVMSTFVKAGFVEVSRRHEARPIMRYLVR